MHSTLLPSVYLASCSALAIIAPVRLWVIQVTLRPVWRVFCIEEWIWFSVRQETAEVCDPRLINRIRGLAYLKCSRLSAHYRFIKFVSDVAACIAVTVFGGWLLFHGNHGSRAYSQGNAFHFPRDCIAMFKASRTFISFRMNLSGMVSGHVGGAVVNCIVCTCVCDFHSCHSFKPGVVWSLRFPGR
jgi:hypothetical protein